MLKRTSKSVHVFERMIKFLRFFDEQALDREFAHWIRIEYISQVSFNAEEYVSHGVGCLDAGLAHSDVEVRRVTLAVSVEVFAFQ